MSNVVEPSAGAPDRTALLVDDHRIFAEVLASRLRATGVVNTTHLAFGMDQARALLRATTPDLVILDYHLGPDCGLDLVPDISALTPGADVVIVSSSLVPEDISDAFERGVRGWVAKTGRMDELLAGIGVVANGEMYLSSTAVGVITAALSTARRSPSHPSGFAAECSERELEVLRCLLAGMSRTEVAETLHISPNTVRTHVQRLFRIADVHSTLALLAAARDAGVTPLDAGSS